MVLAMEATAKRLVIPYTETYSCPFVGRAGVLVFTVGACKGVVSVGGLSSAPGHRLKHFGAILSVAAGDSFKFRKDQKHVIGQENLTFTCTLRKFGGLAPIPCKLENFVQVAIKCLRLKEILPVLMAKMTWAKVLFGRKVIFSLTTKRQDLA